jgi:hypothetical protein
MEVIYDESPTITKDSKSNQRRFTTKKSNSLTLKDSGELDINQSIMGPNVNLKLPKKSSFSEIEKEIFKTKINKIKKTELCKNWELYGNCYFKDTCSFAHGEGELRRKSNSLNIKYKTRKCVVFKNKMYCPFGRRCQYIHVLPHSKLLTYNYKMNFFAATILNELYRTDEEIELMYIIANRKYQR